MGDYKTKDLIVKFLQDKYLVKSQVATHLDHSFKLLYSSCKKLCNNVKDDVLKVVPTLNLDCIERNSSSFEFRFGDESLVFQKINFVLQVDKSHSIWTSSYLSDNYLNSYCGVINIYNFLTDAFRNNRMEESGYLIARIFVNHENHFFTEGKRQLGFLYNDFESSELNENSLYNICESALLYCLDFDPSVPDYELVSSITVGALKDQIDYSMAPAQKKLGFRFYDE
jgi:hypothetical protein